MNGDSNATPKVCLVCKRVQGFLRACSFHCWMIQKPTHEIDVDVVGILKSMCTCSGRVQGDVLLVSK